MSTATLADTLPRRAKAGIGLLVAVAVGTYLLILAVVAGATGEIIQYVTSVLVVFAITVLLVLSIDIMRQKFS